MSLVDPATGEVVVGHQVMPEMTTAARAALRASILKFGVLVPVAFDQHGNIIDGHNRVAIADELGISYGHTTHVVRDHEHAVELAATLNLDRRHMNEATRAQIARALREEGHGLRAIAGALGVGKSTIERDLSGAPESHHNRQVSRDGTPDIESGPERTIGTDGKKYPRQANKWTDEALLNLLALNEGGMTQSVLADMHGCTQANIADRLAQARKLTDESRFTRDNPPRHNDRSRSASAARRRIVAELAADHHSSHQIAEILGVDQRSVWSITKECGIDVPADALLSGTKRPDSNRIVSETVSTLEGVVFGLTLVDHGDVDSAQVAAWAESLRSSIKSLNRFLKELTR